LSYKYGVADMRNSINLKIYQKIKKIYKNTAAFDPFVTDKKLNNKNSIKKLESFDVVMFLSKGKIYKKLFDRLSRKKQTSIFDPFFYYKNKI